MDGDCNRNGEECSVLFHSTCSTTYNHVRISTRPVLYIK